VTAHVTAHGARIDGKMIECERHERGDGEATARDEPSGASGAHQGEPKGPEIFDAGGSGLPLPEQIIERLDTGRTRRAWSSEERLRRLRALADAIVAAEEEERRRIAHTLHDGAVQTLGAAVIRTGALRGSLDGAQREEAERIEALLRDAMQQLRDLTSRLAPPVLFEFGLVPALEWLAKQHAREGSLRVTIDARDGASGLSDRLRLVLYRAVRELLVNVVKHSGMKEAEIVIEREGERLRLRIKDRGKGFNAEEVQEHAERGFGLFGIEERLALYGGELRIESAVGKGAIVTLLVPIDGHVGPASEEMS
jgi:signal transduction histidine kinase